MSHKRRRVGVGLLSVGLLLFAFSLYPAPPGASGSITSTTTSTTTSDTGGGKVTVLLLMKDTGGNQLSGQVSFDGQAYSTGATISVPTGWHAYNCGPISGYSPQSSQGNTFVGGAESFVCLYNPAIMPMYVLTIAAKDSNGNPVNGQISVNGSTIGTGTASTTLNQGLYLISCGSAAGYTAPPPFKVSLYYSITTTCQYLFPTAAQTTLTVLVQFYSISAKQYFPLASVNPQLSDGQTKLTNSSGRASFTVAQNMAYTVTVANSGYGTQSKSIQVGTSPQTVTISFATGGFSTIGSIGPYPVTTQGLQILAAILVVVGILLLF